MCCLSILVSLMLNTFLSSHAFFALGWLGFFDIIEPLWIILRKNKLKLWCRLTEIYCSDLFIIHMFLLHLLWFILRNNKLVLWCRLTGIYCSDLFVIFHLSDLFWERINQYFDADWLKFIALIYLSFTCFCFICFDLFWEITN